MTGGRTLPAALLVLAACTGGEEDAPVVTPPPREAESAPSPPAVTTTPQPQRAGPLVIRVTGSDYHWLLRYPGPDGRLDTPDDVQAQRHLHLPARREILIDLASTDFVYTFYVPYLDILEVAVPEVLFEFEFETGGPGEHHLFGSQMCGYTHPELLGDVVILEASEFEAWVLAQQD